jgi:hypothetical protein
MRSCEENRGWNGRALSKYSAAVADLGAGAMLSFNGQTCELSIPVLF